MMSFHWRLGIGPEDVRRDAISVTKYPCLELDGSIGYCGGCLRRSHEIIL
jgi:hypothetical protein